MGVVIGFVMNSYAVLRGHWVCDEQLRCSTRSMGFVMNSYAVLFMSIRSGWTDMLFSTTVQRGSLRVTLHVPFACVNAVKPIGD